MVYRMPGRFLFVMLLAMAGHAEGEPAPGVVVLPGSSGPSPAPSYLPAEPHHRHQPTDCATDQRRALVRWWQDRAKPSLQQLHWSYHEQFEEAPFGIRMPFGTSFRGYQQQQIRNGRLAGLFLYHYDFQPGSSVLNPQGERRLKALLDQLPWWAGQPLRIEATPDDPRLAQDRRQYVQDLLDSIEVVATVEVGVPAGWVPAGDEAEMLDARRRSQLRGGALPTTPRP